jgi:hypothetical protein
LIGRGKAMRFQQESHRFHDADLSRKDLIRSTQTSKGREYSGSHPQKHFQIKR